MDVAPDGLPVAFHDPPAREFPFTITAYGPDGSVVWSETIEGPSVLRVPGTGPGSVTRVVRECADGTVEEWTA